MTLPEFSRAVTCASAVSGSVERVTVWNWQPAPLSALSTAALMLSGSPSIAVASRRFRNMSRTDVFGV